MKKLTKQILALTAAAMTFVCFDTAVYQLFTKRCIPDTSNGMQAKSIDLDKYLPFDDNSQIVNIRSDFRLTNDLPVMDGAAALYPICSAFVNAVYPEDSVSFADSDFTADSKLQMRNTRAAYKAVVDGDDDIIICARPSDEQLQYAANNGVELELVPIGCEAFVFLVNGDNPVENLTTEQVRGIFGGEYKFWSELGGKALPIEPLTRNKGSGSQTAMENFMGDTPIKKSPLGVFGSSIGFSFRYYVEDVVRHGNVKMIALDGVYPDRQSIADGSYPIVSNFYAVYDKANKNPHIQPFIDWMLSEEGQKIVDETGYIPVERK